MCMINGMLYWRKKRRLTAAELAEQAGLSCATILGLEHEIRLSTSLTVYKSVADALGVTVEMLLKDYDSCELKDGENRRKKTRREFGNSAVAVYCEKHNLTYSQLADRLGLTSRERARQLCQGETASVKHIKTLAEYEDLTIEDFCELYAVA